MYVDDDTWLFVVGVLYSVLGLAAAARIIVKYVNDSYEIVTAARSVYLVFTALLVYCASRATILFLVWAGDVTRDDGLTRNLYDSIPSAFFDVLQTAMIAKWVGHANDISLVLRRQEFHYGPVAIWVSVAMTVINVIVALVCVGVCRPKGAEHDNRWVWNEVLDIFSGAIYMVNGLFFGFLGLVLRSLWSPTSFAEKVMSARILFMAFFFGGMCTARGGVMIALGATQGSLHQTASTWGTPCALTVEWLCLVVSMFVLTSSRSAKQQSPSRTSTFGSAVKSMSTRRQSVARWFKSSALSRGPSTSGSTSDGGGEAPLVNEKEDDRDSELTVTSPHINADELTSS